MTTIVLNTSAWDVRPTFPDLTERGTGWDVFWRVSPSFMAGPGWMHHCRRLYFSSESVYGCRSTWLSHVDRQTDEYLDQDWGPMELAVTMGVGSL